MISNRLRAALFVLAASAATSACTNFGPYGGIGVGVGSGYGGYGYDPYYAGYGYGSGYGYNPYGWYNGFYYPGAGYWVYDPDRNRREMTPEERAYWRARFQSRFGNGAPKENWEGFGTIARNSSLAKPTSSPSAAAVGQADERSLRQISEARRQRQEAVRTERQQARAERQESMRQEAVERRQPRPRKSTDE